MNAQSDNIYAVLRKTVLLVAGVVMLLWFLREVADVLLMSAFALILAIVLNAPVTWLEQRRVPRVWASLIVFVVLIASVVLLGWFVVPRLAGEASDLLSQLPEYATTLRERIRSWLAPYPQLQEQFPLTADSASEMLPSLPALTRRVSGFSLSLFTVIAAVLILLSMVLYAVLNPRPLLRSYLDIFPENQRDKAARAFSSTSVMLLGWIRANVIIGAIETILSGVVLSLLSVPGALVWAALAFFAELVPKVGIYLMAIPPVLVALAVSPMTAVWVAVFYLVMSETMSNFVTPRIRASAMSLHPVSVLFLMLAMAAAFGVLGALIATPIAAFIKAYFEEFYLNGKGEAARHNVLVEGMVKHAVPPAHDEVIVDV